MISHTRSGLDLEWSEMEPRRRRARSACPVRGIFKMKSILTAVHRYFSDQKYEGSCGYHMRAKPSRPFVRPWLQSLGVICKSDNR
uniref:Uncharacterized protein n=1 Tax=Romanomermis culicivorax TaxID=13658 RepID=A0A915HUZ4_ROMCU